MSTEIDDAVEVEANQPVGRCPRCDTTVYSDVGFCGVCHPEKL